MRNAVRLSAFLLCLLLIAPWRANAAKVVYQGNKQVKRAALTIDDCWDAAQVRLALEAADKYGVSLTFFPCGQAIKRRPAIWKDIAASRHEIGNHSYNHKSFLKINQAQIASQLKSTQKALNKAVGKKHPMTLVRPPYGDGGYRRKISKPMLSAMKKQGYTHAVMWTVNDGISASKIVKLTKPGGIVLFHTKPESIKELIRVIPKLQAAGFELVTVSELLNLNKEGASGGDEMMDEAETASLPEDRWANAPISFPVTSL